MESFKIFIAEDDISYSEILKYHLELNPDNEVKTFDSGKKLIKALHEKPDLITLDYSLPDTNGKKLLSILKKESPNCQVVIVSGQEDIATAVQLLKDGAYDYLVKDDNTKDKIWQAILHIKENLQLKNQIDQLKIEVQKKYDFSKSIKVNSPKIKKVVRLLEKAITNNITVSITGETGTGKEVIAKAIHYNSKRKKEPKLDWFEAILNKSYELTVGGRLGPGPTDNKETIVLGWVIRWTDEGIEYEADPRQVEKLL